MVCFLKSLLITSKKNPHQNIFYITLNLSVRPQKAKMNKNINVNLSSAIQDRSLILF